MSDVRESLEEIKVVSAFDNQEVSSGFGADVDGVELDRSDYDMPRVVKFTVQGSGDLTSSDTLEFRLEHEEEGGSYSDTGDVVTYEGDSSPKQVTKEIRLDDKKKHVRLYLDSDNSSLGQASDVAVSAALAGMKTVPQD
jgi:hypothetical protein